MDCKARVMKRLFGDAAVQQSKTPANVLKSFAKRAQAALQDIFIQANNADIVVDQLSKKVKTMRDAAKQRKGLSAGNYESAIKDIIEHKHMFDKAVGKLSDAIAKEEKFINEVESRYGKTATLKVFEAARG